MRIQVEAEKAFHNPTKEDRRKTKWSPKKNDYQFDSVISSIVHFSLFITLGVLLYTGPMKSYLEEETTFIEDELETDEGNVFSCSKSLTKNYSECS